MTSDPAVALRAAYEKTTQGEWAYRPSHSDKVDGVVYVIGSGAVAYDIDTPDAAFIVAAHEHTPALLAEVEKSRRVTQSIKDTLALLPTYPADKVPEILDSLRELLEQMDMPKPAE